MAELNEVIQIIANNTIAAGKPAEPLIGTVQETNPLSIKISDKLLLPRGNITLIKGTNLEKGDRVLLIRASGGQQFFVIGEVE